MQEFNWELLKEKSSVFLRKDITVVALIFIINSMTALLKDIFFASYLGTSQYADTFLLAFFLPDTLGTGLLAATLGASCVPVFSKVYSNSGQKRLNRSIKEISIVVFLMLLVLNVALYALRDIVSRIMGYAPGNEAIGLFHHLLTVLLPYMMIIPFVTIGASALQAQGRFGVASMPQTVFNLVFLGSILFSTLLKIPLSNGVYIIAYSVVGASVAMAALVWIPFAKSHYKYVSADETKDKLKADLRDSPELAGIFRVFIPYILILLSTQSVLYVERLLASGLDPGSVTGVNYAFRLSQVPVWIFAAAISVVVLPELSRAAGFGREEEFKVAFQKNLILIFVITVPISLILFILRVPIITVLLKHGAFDMLSLQKTSTVLSGFSLSVIGQCIVYISLRAFMAMGKMLAPMFISFAAAALNIIADIVLVNKAGLAGIGYGSIIGSAINVVLIVYTLHKMLNFNFRKLVAQLITILLANIPLAVVVAVAGKLWDVVVSHSSWGVKFLYLCMSIFFAVVIYCLCVYNCKSVKRNI